jgi:EAL domain-containing protein (putative c-di-GMP-specific phosphodiesterase class I)
MVIELADVHSVIENEVVIPYFQPLVELRSGQLYGFEMLARWQHADLGPILPPNFIAIAEQSGLIWQMTWQLLRRAFRDQRTDRWLPNCRQRPGRRPSHSLSLILQRIDQRWNSPRIRMLRQLIGRVRTQPAKQDPSA